MSQVFSNVVEMVLSGLGVGAVGWVFWRALKRSDDPPKLVFKWMFSAVVIWFGFIKTALPAFANGGLEAMYGLSLTLVFGLTMAITWRHNITDLVAKPIGALYDGGDQEVTPRPFYSIAKAKRKQAAPLEAIVEIRKQLARFPNDFEGVMLIADIQAEDMHDLSSAEITLNHFCVQPNQLPSQIAACLTQLADWHLKISQDNEAARLALERIIALFPNTEFSVKAAQRVAHLAKTEHLLAPYERKIFVVTAGVPDMGLLAAEQHVKPVEITPEQQAENFVKQLAEHPLDMEVREKLAMLYARHYRRLDLAVDQLEQMIAAPNQPPKLVAHWLNLLADFQIQLGGDYAAARAALERIVQQFPEGAAAQVAQRRVEYLKLELKGQKEGQAVKLGAYEQDVGLKQDLPR